MNTQAEVRPTFGEVALGPATLVAALLALAGVGPGLGFLVQVDGPDTTQVLLLIGGTILALAAIWMGTASRVEKNPGARWTSLGIACGVLALFAPTLLALLGLFLGVGPIAFTALFACAVAVFGVIEFALRFRSGHSAAGAGSRIGLASCWIASISGVVLIAALVAMRESTAKFWVVVACQLAAVPAIGMGARDLLQGKHRPHHAIVGTKLAALTLSLPTLLLCAAILLDID